MISGYSHLCYTDDRGLHINMIEPIRIPPNEARKKVLSHEALFVCAYDDEVKFKNNHLEGALSFGEFIGRIGSLSRDQEIIFYCA
jgi:hypothetical protein